MARTVKPLKGPPSQITEQLVSRVLADLPPLFSRKLFRAAFTGRRRLSRDHKDALLKRLIAQGRIVRADGVGRFAMVDGDGSPEPSQEFVARRLSALPWRFSRIVFLRIFRGLEPRKSHVRRDALLRDLLSEGKLRRIDRGQYTRVVDGNLFAPEGSP